MSLAQIKEELERLNDEQRREVLAWLFTRQASDDEERQRMLAERIDDKDPTHWISLDELKKRWA